jgi:hypothetical protein
MCRFRSVKVKENAISLKTRVFHGRKVTTINANDVEYIECEVIDNTSHIKKLNESYRHLRITSTRTKSVFANFDKK